MKPVKTSAAVIVAFWAMTAAAPALEVTPVGIITEELGAPTAIAAADDEIAVLEPYAQRISLYTADGRITRRVDIAGDAIGLARLSGSHYLFCDRSRQAIVEVDFDTDRQSVFLGDGLVGDPVDIVVSGSMRYVLDAGVRRILVLDAAGTITDRIALSAAGAEVVGFPASFAYDAARGVFHVFDQLSSRVLTISRSGERLNAFCSFGGGDGEITRGGDMVCDADGYIYISDRYQGRVAVFDPDGRFVANIDPRTYDGGSLSIPTGLAIDPQGLVYMASTESRSIHIIYVEKAGEAGRAATARPLHPANYDTVAIGGLELVAEVLPVPGVTGLDFQLVSVADTLAAIAEAVNLAPGGEREPGSLIAVWQPEEPLVAGGLYGWRVRVRMNEETGDWSAVQWFTVAGVPGDYRLEQNYPNPFNPQTTISLEIPYAAPAAMTIYNLMGQQVWQRAYELLPAGRHHVVWDGTDAGGRSVASGVYFYRFTTGAFTQTRKMVLLK